MGSISLITSSTSTEPQVPKMSKGTKLRLVKIKACFIQPWTPFLPWTQVLGVSLFTVCVSIRRIPYPSQNSQLQIIFSVWGDDSVSNALAMKSKGPTFGFPSIYAAARHRSPCLSTQTWGSRDRQILKAHCLASLAKYVSSAFKERGVRQVPSQNERAGNVTW